MTNPAHLFNGDSNFLFSDHFLGPQYRPYQPATIRHYIDCLADAGIDTYLANANCQKPWYPSRSLEHVLQGYTRGDRAFVRDQLPLICDDFYPQHLEAGLSAMARMLDRMLDLQEAGVDWLETVVSHCGARGVKPWVSIRMNDNHGSVNWAQSFFNCPPQRDPAMRLTGRRLDPASPSAAHMQGCDYAQESVRRYFFDMIDELLRDYDFQGVELDWLRTPMCCNPPATRRQTDAVTRWHKELRALCERKAKQTGRPCPFGVRLPPRVELLKHIGLDIIGMAQDGVFDFVGITNYFQSSWDVDHHRLRQLLGDQVALFGVVETLPNYLTLIDPTSGRRAVRHISAHEAMIRAAAVNKLVDGVDGLYWYNFFCARQPRYEHLAGMNDLEAQRGRPKLYTLASSPGSATFEPFELAEQLTCRIDPGRQHTFHLPMCAEPASSLTVTVQIVVERCAGMTVRFGVAINDGWPNYEAHETRHALVAIEGLSQHLPEHRAFNFRFPASVLVEGCNRFTLYNGCTGNEMAYDGSVGPLVVRSFEVGVGV